MPPAADLSDAELKKRFDEIDTSGDGSLDEDELLTVFRNLGNEVRTPRARGGGGARREHVAPRVPAGGRPRGDPPPFTRAMRMRVRGRGDVASPCGCGAPRVR